MNRVPIAAIAFPALGLALAFGPANGQEPARETNGPTASRAEWRREDAGPRPASESSIPVPIVEAAGQVRAGDSVVIRWGPFGREVEELELLLSIDGGRRFNLRVSPELEGPANRYVWRVPNLGTHDARVRIRARLDGREVNGPPSASFTMVPDRGRPREPWLFHEGGWWTERNAESCVPWGLGAPKQGAAFGAVESEPLSEAPVRYTVPVPALRFRPSSPSDPLAPGALSAPRPRSPSRTRPLRE